MWGGGLSSWWLWFTLNIDRRLASTETERGCEINILQVMKYLLIISILSLSVVSLYRVGAKTRKDIFVLVAATESRGRQV